MGKTHNKNAPAVGARIKAARMERGLTQAELADKMKTNIYALNRYEAGISLPDRDAVYLIASVLQVPPGRLLQASETGKEEP